MKHIHRLNPFNNSSGHNSLYFFLLIFLAAAGLRAYTLDRTIGIGYRGLDEGLIIRTYVYKPVEYILHNYKEGRSHHVFNTVILHFMAELFGKDNSFALRFPAFLAGILTLWLTFKTAHILFKSNSVSRLAILFSAMWPIHIIYSQTARGYSLIIFLSILILYSALKLLENHTPIKWTLVLILSSFLSVFTIPTNIYFLLGLAGWLCLPLLTSKFSKDYNFDTPSRKNKISLIFTVSVVISILCFLAYFPLIDQIQTEAQSEINFVKSIFGDSIFLLISKLIIETIRLIFFGNLIWLAPFFLIGVAFESPQKTSYRLIPIFIFFLPFLINILTGIAGYPRNYLFNLPIFIIFFAAGTHSLARYISKTLNRPSAQDTLTIALALTVAVTSLNFLFSSYYPTIIKMDRKIPLDLIHDRSNPSDLIIVPNTYNYFYFRELTEQNLINLFYSNKITGIRVIHSDLNFRKRFFAETGTNKKMYVFDNPFYEEDIKTLELPKLFKISEMTSGISPVTLPEDFETNTNWVSEFGKGLFLKNSKHKLTGKYSLSIQADKAQKFVLKTSVPGPIRIKNLSYIIFLWAGYNVTKGNPIHIPSVVLKNPELGDKKIILRLGRLPGSLKALEMWDDVPGSENFYWGIHPFIGVLPSGNYSMDIIVNVDKGQQVLYDGFRIAILERNPKGNPTPSSFSPHSDSGKTIQ